MADSMNQAEQPVKKIYERKEFVPIVVFGSIFFILLLSTALSGHPPSISSMNQDHNLTYEVITLEGQNFGDSDDGGEIRIGDLILAPSNFSKWSDAKIVVNLPREVPSGVISIITKNGKCGGGIYINPEEVPRLASYVDPLITEVVPNKVSIGTVIQIHGDRFGIVQGDGEVFFTWREESRNETDAQKLSDPVMNARKRDLDYLFWSDNEILVRVPDGIQTGKVAVVTPGGMSNFKHIDLDSPVGTKEYYDRNKYPLRFSFSVSNKNPAQKIPSKVWMPLPSQWPEMRRIDKYKTTIESNDTMFQGAALFDFEDTSLDSPFTVTAEVIFDLYAIKSNIKYDSIKKSENIESDFFKNFTGSDYWVRPNDPYIQAIFYKYFEKEQNPYILAKMIYNKLRNEFSSEAVEADSFEELQPYIMKKSGNSKVYALTYCSLLRAFRIPSRVVGGYIIDKEKTLSPHYWVEFFIDEFGWIPVDPFLGDEQENSLFQKGDEYQKFYFGNLDNRHIPLAKGSAEIPLLLPNGRTTRFNQIPVFYSHLAEIDNVADNIVIEWHEPELIGIY